MLLTGAIIFGIRQQDLFVVAEEARALAHALIVPCGADNEGCVKCGRLSRLAKPEPLERLPEEPPYPVSLDAALRV